MGTGSLGIVIQARIWAKRLPGKVLIDLGGETVLQHVVRRCRMVPGHPLVFVATPDLALIPVIHKYGAIPYLGDENNVLKRYVDCAKANGLDAVIRVTADCPFVDPWVIRNLIDLWEPGKLDYASNVLKRTYPYGLDCEIASTKALDGILRRTYERKYLEHVTLYIREHLDEYRVANLAGETDFTAHDWRLDRPEDFPRLKDLYSKSGGSVVYPFFDMLRYSRKLDYGAEHLRIPVEYRSAAGGNPTTHVGDAVSADHPTDKPGSPWYERGSINPPPRQESTAGHV